MARVVWDSTVFGKKALSLQSPFLAIRSVLLLSVEMQAEERLCIAISGWLSAELSHK